MDIKILYIAIKVLSPAVKRGTTGKGCTVTVHVVRNERIPRPWENSRRTRTPIN